MFQSLSGLTLGLNFPRSSWTRHLNFLFQSLSGLTLGLNDAQGKARRRFVKSFNPFQG